MKLILTLASFVVFTTVLTAQKKNTATFTAVKYQSLNPDPFKNMPVSHIGLDYYYVEQLGKGERLWYEIVIAEEKLSIHFHARGIANFQKTDYEYEGKLPAATVQQLKTVYGKAALIQKIQGVPVNDDNYTTKEILITKSYSKLIAGGWYSGNMKGGTDLQKQIKAQKQQTNNLGGNPEIIIAEMKKAFPALPGLMKKAHRSVKR